MSPFRSFGFDSAVIVLLSDTDYAVSRASKVPRHAGRFHPRERCRVLELGRLLGKLGQHRVDADRAEHFRQPVIDVAEHVGLAQVDEEDDEN